MLRILTHSLLPFAPTGPAEDAAHDPRPKAYRTLIVHEHMMQCSPYGPLAELERKEKKRRA